MGAVLLFVVVFTCAWLDRTYGATVAVLVAGIAVVLWLLLGVVIPTLDANREWFAWHLNRMDPNPRPAPRPTRDTDGERQVPGAPDLAGELRATGWDAWAASHRLQVLDVTPDPGHPGADLTLLEVTAGRWAGTRLVQVIDASPNPAGVHERHALPVPPTCTTALEAVAATWGLPAAAYRPQRHT